MAWAIWDVPVRELLICSANHSLSYWRVQLQSNILIANIMPFQLKKIIRITVSYFLYPQNFYFFAQNWIINQILRANSGRRYHMAYGRCRQKFSRYSSNLWDTCHRSNYISFFDILDFERNLNLYLSNKMNWFSHSVLLMLTWCFIILIITCYKI